jgi:hypothetical protein
LIAESRTIGSFGGASFFEARYCPRKTGAQRLRLGHGETRRRATR